MRLSIENPGDGQKDETRRLQNRRRASKCPAYGRFHVFQHFARDQEIERSDRGSVPGQVESRILVQVGVSIGKPLFQSGCDRVAIRQSKPCNGLIRREAWQWNARAE